MRASSFSCCFVFFTLRISTIVIIIMFLPSIFRGEGKKSIFGCGVLLSFFLGTDVIV